MQIFDTIKKTEYNTAVALGFFDGVHRGHQEVIKQCKARKKDDERLTVFTFKNSPSSSFSNSPKPLLSTNEEKFRMFESLGVEVVFCVDFNEVKDLTAESFVYDIIIDKISAKSVTTGFNYHFAKGGTATTDDLKNLCEKRAIPVHICEPMKNDNEVISSTRIRECIKNGDISCANSLLGYNFSVKSTIHSGNHIGTKLESPTINQSLNKALVTPKFGVYATKVTVDNKTYFGASNIGMHPTVGKTTPLCETHLLNYSGDELYGKSATTELLYFIRAEKKFENTDILKKQIQEDILSIKALFCI